MPHLRSVARELRREAERGATREQLDARIRSGGAVSRLDRAVLETYVWALTRVAVRAPEGGGEEGGARQ